MFVIAAIVLFFVDLLAFILFKGWVLYSLLSLFLFINLRTRQNIIYLNCFFIFLFLVQDYFALGRVGLSLIYSIPICMFSPFLRKLFDCTTIAFSLISLFVLLLFNLFFVKYLVLGLNITLHSTYLYIFINMIVGYLIFLGIPGNRS